MTTVRERVLEILATSSLSDPRDIADKIIGDLTARERQAALAEVLPEYVRITLHAGRGHHPTSDEPGSTQGTRTQDVAEPGSSRWRRVSSVFTGRYKPLDTWKPLRECTRDDVLALVDDYRKRAAQNTRKADQFEALAKRMAKAKVATVGDLPESVVEEILR